MYITRDLNQHDYAWVCDCNPTPHYDRMDNDDTKIVCLHCKKSATAGDLKRAFKLRMAAMRRRKPDQGDKV